VEDDATIRRELGALLGKYGYGVTAVEDFDDVAGHVLGAGPQLVLLDLNLPGRDGFDVCREIRKTSDVPIIVVTSRDSEMDELMSLNLGADSFVSKPYNTGILLARIAALLSRAYGAGSAARPSYAGLTLDLGRSAAERDGASVDLTKNEARILQLLIERRGEIVPRDDIMNALWQTDAFVDDNTLTVNVNRLRKKLADIGAPDALKTRRGLGYSL
jgi:DNA-binding response OmpR family regulator